MTTTDEQCLTAFVDGRYVDAEPLARGILALSTPEVWAAHVLVTSVRRQGRSEDAATVAKKLAQAFSGDAWRLALFRLSTGEKGAAELFAAVPAGQLTALARLQIHYYAGAGLIGRGDAEAAQGEWALAVDAGGEAGVEASPELRLAIAEAARAGESLAIERRAKPTVTHDTHETQALRSFFSRDYASAERLLRAAVERRSSGGRAAVGSNARQASGIASWVPYALVASVRLQGRPDDARAVGLSLVEELADDPWLQLLVRVGLGDVSVEAALAGARDEAQACQAHFYAGVWFASAGEDVKCYAHSFSACSIQSSKEDSKW